MMHRYNYLLLIGAILAAGPVSAQDQVTLTPSKDNTIFEESGSESNGAGQYLFVGRTARDGGPIRRALVAFDIAGDVPSGVRVDSVEFTVEMNKTIAGSTPVRIHRLTSDWGEGSSDAPGEEGTGTSASINDATWTYAFFDTDEWDVEGGDYAAEASATFDVGGNGDYAVRSSDGLAADVQQWLDDPESNFGWILVGDESDLTTAKRFASSEHSSEGSRPSLTVYYSESTAAEDEGLPAAFVLEGNYPNPFSRSTHIRYVLDRPSTVALAVYDITGRPVRTVPRRFQEAGPHELELVAGGLAAGLYLYCVTNDAARACRTLTVLP